MMANFLSSPTTLVVNVLLLSLTVLLPIVMVMMAILMEALWLLPMSTGSLPDVLSAGTLSVASMFVMTFKVLLISSFMCCAARTGDPFSSH